MQLILDTLGTKLHIQNGLFTVRMQEQVRQIPPDKLEGIMISKGILISSDALLMALQYDIDVVLLDYHGTPKGRLWNNKFGSITTVRHKQIEFAQHAKGMMWAKERVQIKIAEQLAFAYQIRYMPDTQQPEKLDKPIQYIQNIYDKLKELPHTFVPDEAFAATLRGWEGTAAKQYFQLLAKALPAFYKFDVRNRRPAKDIFNCLLNYLYGVLYAHVESALIRAGIDPSIGIWHTDEYNKPVLVYDCIEPYRVWADITAFRLCQSYAVGVNDIRAYQDGVWLNASGKKTAVTLFNTYLDEVIPYYGRRRSRVNNIYLDAHEFAQRILKFEP